MGRKRMIGICCAVAVLFSLLVILPSIWPFGGSRYSCWVERDRFSLEMARLNCTVEESFSLDAGDTVEVSIVRASGDLIICIGQEGREPIYEGRNPELNRFRVSVAQGGEYLISVTGKRARGSLTFQINKTTH